MKYLLHYQMNLADEIDVVFTRIYNAEEKEEMIGRVFSLGSGNLQDDTQYNVESEDFIEITDKEVLVLKKLKLDSINTGFNFNNEEDEEDAISICHECWYHNDRYEDNIYPCDECDGFKHFEQHKLQYKKRVCPNCNKEFESKREFCSTECLIEKRKKELKEG